MKSARLYVHGDDVGLNVSITETTHERMRGLLGRDALPSGEALLLNRCGSVHTFGMRFDIDVLFLDRHLRVVAIHREVRRRRMVFSLRASHTLEMQANAARQHGLAIGDSLVLEATS